MPEIVRMGMLELRFLATKQETDASLDLFEMTLQPDARMPVPHHHRDWDETIYGLVGTTTWTVAGDAVDVMPGESLFIRRGVVHGFTNRSSAPATCLCVLTPGILDPQYFRDVASLVAGGAPDPEAMRATMMRYGLIPAPPDQSPAAPRS